MNEKQIKIILTGLGGQGVLTAGILIAQTAIEEKLYTTWFPSYGAEMRGGISSSTVIISNDEIGSPIVLNPDILISLNESSLSKFAQKINNNTIVVTNSTITSNIKIKNKKIYHIPMTDTANKTIKNLRTINMIAVGFLIKLINSSFRNYENKNIETIIHLENALKACEKIFKSKKKLIEVNKKAIYVGYNFV
ncbi:MAG: 2-oxoacid:acceptor oxidoreductase family protein [Endomicrobium sp.]|jgi:2-oxoglutarate ferredoxin oxidoreductase subunit gamma|nr:2-oxoacid:acceptor oxidoreductase family protein [Endomicrobium sp.]